MEHTLLVKVIKGDHFGIDPSKLLITWIIVDNGAIVAPSPRGQQGHFLVFYNETDIALCATREIEELTALTIKKVEIEYEKSGFITLMNDHDPFTISKSL